MQDRIKELGELKDGWDGYQGIPPTEMALETAKNLALVPVCHGGLQFEMHAGGVNVEISIEPTGEVSSVFFERAGRQ